MKLANFSNELPDALTGGPAIATTTVVSSHASGTAVGAHYASAVSIADAGGYFTGSDVEAALQELGMGNSPLVVYDEGVLVGTPTAMDFIGSGVYAALSGGTAQITVTTGSAFSNIPIFDEGALQGTATTGFDFVGAGVSAAVSGGTAVVTVTGGTATGGLYPLDDTYGIDSTYGDHFTGTALGTAWTRRNYIAGDETYQVGINQTYLRIKPDGQSNGDGYYRTAPASDFTIAMKMIPRGLYTNAANLGPAILDSSGNGVGIVLYTTPNSPLLVKITTWSTYGSSYVQPGGSGANLEYFAAGKANNRPIWYYLRKSSDNYYFAYSTDGETWSVESDALAYTFTVAYIAMLHGPLGSVSTSALSRYDIDWFSTVTL